jgi:hypothetical protein
MAGFAFVIFQLSKPDLGSIANRGRTPLKEVRPFGSYGGYRTVRVILSVDVIDPEVPVTVMV